MDKGNNNLFYYHDLMSYWLIYNNKWKAVMNIKPPDMLAYFKHVDI